MFIEGQSAEQPGILCALFEQKRKISLDKPLFMKDEIDSSIMVLCQGSLNRLMNPTVELHELGDRYTRYVERSVSVMRGQRPC